MAGSPGTIVESLPGTGGYFQFSWQKTAGGADGEIPEGCGSKLVEEPDVHPARTAKTTPTTTACVRDIDPLLGP